MTLPKWISRHLRIETLLALIVVVACAWNVLHLILYEYLPLPYFYVPEDTFMDWFNTSYYAHIDGAYDSWGTVYPPFSFVFLKFFTLPVCYQDANVGLIAAEASGYYARSCDWYGLASIHFFYFLNFVLAGLTFRKLDSRTALARTLALGLSYPMTFALERGNLLLPAFTFLLLAYGPLVRSARLRWVALAFAINLKIYLIGTLFAQLLRRKWRWFEGGLIVTVIVYLVSFAIVGQGSPFQIAGNIAAFNEVMHSKSNPIELIIGLTYYPVLELINGEWPVSTIVGSTIADSATHWIPIVIHLTQALIVAAALAAAFRPEAVTRHRAVFLSVTLALISAEAGVYCQVFIILFVFMERWRGIGPKLALIVAYIMCIPNDLMTLYDVPPLVISGFYGWHTIIANYKVGLMPFVRPGLVLLVAIILSLTTLFDVWAHLLRNGLRDRWRYRENFQVTRKEAHEQGS